MLNKIELTKTIKNYVKNHLELQGSKIDTKDVEKCAKDCNCEIINVMCYLWFGKVI